MIVRRLNKDKFHASFYFVGVAGKILNGQNSGLAFDKRKANFVLTLIKSNETDQLKKVANIP